jgi:hypothetical protein
MFFLLKATFYTLIFIYLLCCRSLFINLFCVYVVDLPSFIYLFYLYVVDLNSFIYLFCLYAVNLPLFIYLFIYLFIWFICRRSSISWLQQCLLQKHI